MLSRYLVRFLNTQLLILVLLFVVVPTPATIICFRSSSVLSGAYSSEYSMAASSNAYMLIYALKDRPTVAQPQPPATILKLAQQGAVVDFDDHR